MEFKVGGPDVLFFLPAVSHRLSPTSIKPSGSLPILASPSIRRLQTGTTSIPPPTLPYPSLRENNRKQMESSF